MKDYDLHLAAASISPSTVAKLSQTGFIRDEFANLTYCNTGDYHGTFRGTLPLPNRALWDKVCGLLEGDERFSGYMEEEATEAEWRRPLAGDGAFMPDPLPPLMTIACPPGMRKACDIHMSVFLDASTEAAVNYMKRLEVSSVDRPGPEGVRRVFTITCESLADGRRLFQVLHERLSAVPGLRGRMKLEVTTKHYRKPDDAVTLPLATQAAVAAWFEELRRREGWCETAEALEVEEYTTV